MRRPSLFFSALLAASFLWTFSISSAQAQSSLSSPPVAWEKSFSHSVEWCVRTSPGVLIVRAGKSLSALDGQSGEQLWSIPEIEIGGGGGMLRTARGNNILEIPGLPLLLVNRAKLPGKEQGELLGIQIWTGAIQWRQAELDDLLSIVPMYGSKRVMLISKKINKTMKSAMMVSQAASHFFWEAQIVNLYWSGPVPFRPILTRLDPLTGKADWTKEFPRHIKPEFLAFRKLGNLIYLQEVSELGGTRLSAISPETGERLWQFKPGVGAFGSVPTPLQFAGGRVIFAARDVFALDPSSGKPAWRVRKLGDLFGMASDGDSIYGTSRKEVFALDASKGTMRWNVAVKPTPTNPVLLPEEKSVVICDKKEFLVIEAATGKVVRRAKTNLDQNQLALWREGKNFLLALNPQFSSLFELSGERSSDEPGVEAEFPAVSFVISQPLPIVGSTRVSDELMQELKANWGWLRESADDDRSRAALERLQQFLERGVANRAMYAVNGNQTVPWHIWSINPATGIKEEYPIKSSKPEAAPDFGMLYEIHKDTVRGLRATPSAAQAVEAQK